MGRVSTGLVFLAVGALAGCSQSHGGSSAAATAAPVTSQAAATTTGGSAAPGSTASGVTAGGSGGSTTSGGVTVVTGPGSTGGGSGSGAGSGAGGTTSPGGVVDLDPPVITLTSPSRGQFTTLSQVQVTGTVLDATGVAYFLIDGTPVAVGAGGQFQTVVNLSDGLNVIELRAADPLAHEAVTCLSVISGRFLPEAQPVGDAVAARLNRPAFAAIERLAAQQLGGTNLGQMIMAQNPLYTGSVAVANVQVTATQASFGTPSLTLDPRQGGLFVHAELPAVDVTVDAQGHAIGIPFSLTTHVTATLAVVEALAVVTVNQGVVTTQLQNATVDLQGFQFSIGGIPSFLSNLATGAVKRLVQDQIKKQVEQVVPQEINKAIAGANGPITKTVMGHQVQVDLIPQAVTFDPDGATVLAGGNLHVAAAPGAPPLNLPTTPGSLTTPGAPPAFGQARAFYVSANDDLLNRIGHAAWRGGLLDLTVDQQTLGGANLPAFVQLDAYLLQTFFPSLIGRLNPADPIELEVSSLTPPLFKTLPAPGLLRAGIGDLTLSVYVAPAGQPRTLVLEVGLQVQADMSVTLSPTNAILLDLTGRPVIQTDVFQTPVAPLDERSVETLVDFLAPPLLQLLAHSWSGFPLPAYPGITLSNVDAVRDGPGLDFVTVRGDL